MKTAQRIGNGRLGSAVISTDPDFRHQLAAALERDATIEMRVEVNEPFTSITDAHLEELRGLDLDLVFVDLESDTQVGLRFVQYLIDSSVAKSVVGAGSADSPELLLQAMEAGIFEFLPKPLDPERVEALLKRLRRRTGKLGANERKTDLGEIFTVFGAKGGSGATTFTVNLAVAIHQLSRKRTLILDLDLGSGDTSLLLGMDPRFSSVDLLRNFHRVDEGLLASYIERHESGVDLLCAPYSPTEFEPVDGDRIGKILAFLREHYEYVLIDSPRVLHPVLFNTFAASDRIYLLTTADLQSIRNAKRYLSHLQELSDRPLEEWIRLLINRDRPSLPISLAEVERSLGLKVQGTIPEAHQRIVASITEGNPAILKGRSSYGDSIRSIAAQVTGIQPPEKKPRFLSSLLTSLRHGARSVGGAWPMSGIRRPPGPDYNSQKES